MLSLPDGGRAPNTAKQTLLGECRGPGRCAPVSAFTAPDPVVRHEIMMDHDASSHTTLRGLPVMPALRREVWYDVVLRPPRSVGQSLKPRVIRSF